MKTVMRMAAAAILSLSAGADAAPQILSIKDYTGRGFVPDLVSYDLGEKIPKRLSVTDPSGKAIPFQVREGHDGALLQFVTDLPANGEVSYVVSDKGDGGVAAGAVRMERDGKRLVVRNGILAVRLPGERQEVFSTPVAADSLPAPILAFQNSTKAWLGESRILTKRAVKAFTVELTQKGSVLVELRYTLEWTEGGRYEATIQVIDRVPLVKVHEAYDMEILDGTHFWELDVAAGWQPDQVQTASHNGNGGGDRNGRVVDFPGLMGGQPVQYLLGDQAWGKLSHLGVFSKAALADAPETFPIVGIVPLRKGLWRKSNAIEVLSVGAGDLRLRFPMGARHADWRRDITSETSPFATAEHEPALSKTYGRRVWGLALGHPAIAADKPANAARQLQRLYGIVGLDRYKDFILDWPDRKPAYPRLYGGKRQGVTADAARCLAGLRKTCRSFFTSTHASHHGHSGNYGIAAQADAVLADPSLPAEVRREIRARVALITYFYEDGDMMSYANGHHHGNPNMGTARFWSAPTFLALVPDHPMYAKWLAHMAEYGAYNLSTQIAPGGGYFEFGAAYHMHGFARAGNGFPALARMKPEIAGPLSAKYVAPDWDYFMNLLTPIDSRWKSRVVPGMANSQSGNTEHLLEAAGALVGHDRALAANLLWAWQANGAKGGANLALAPADLVPVEPALRSEIYPGIGVIFRAHQGPNETWMLFRAGFQWSHWTPADPGEMLLVSRGAVLLPYQPYQYGNSSDVTFDPNNIIRFGHPENAWPHGWGDCNMIDHAFGPSVDYAWASTGYPEWYIDPGISPAWQNSQGVTEAGKRKLDGVYKQVQGAFEWNRQIMFMKGRTATSPNYFVIRDSMPGQGKLSSYLNLDLLGTKKDLTVRGNRLEVETEWPVKMDLTFADAKTIEPESIEQRWRFALHNANLSARVAKGSDASRNWVDKDGQPFDKAPSTAMFEHHTLTRIANAPGKGYYWVIYPRAANEPRPTIELVQEDVLRIKHREGVDTICLSPVAKKITLKAVQFNATAAAVRMTGDTVTLMTAGAGTVGYEKTIITSRGHVEKTWPIGKLPAGIQSGPEASSVALPAPDEGDQELVPGVWARSEDGAPVRYRVASDETLAFAHGDVRIEGRNAVIERVEGGVRFIVPDGSYAKLSVGNRGIRGVGPFDLTFAEAGIEGTVRGEARSMACTWPDAVTRPMFTMDGDRYCAGWADDHSVGKGTGTPQFSVGFGVTSGEHKVGIREWTYPALPPEPAVSKVAF